MLAELQLVHPKNVVLLQDGVRGNSKTSVFEDEKSGVIWLNDTVKESHYSCLKSFWKVKDGELFLDSVSDSKNERYWNKETLVEARNKCEKDSKRRFQMMKERYNPECSVLDVGTGTGGFLKIASSYFRSIHGMEIQQDLLQSLIEDGLKVFPEIKHGQKYDVVTMFHVFEHLTKPMETLVDIYDVLDENGTLVVEVPHAKDALISKYKCKPFQKFTFWEEHLVLHTTESLRTLLEKAGFRNVRFQNVQRYPLANHIFWLMEGKPGGQNVLNVKDEDRSYEKFLIESNMTDTIVAFATK